MAVHTTRMKVLLNIVAGALIALTLPFNARGSEERNGRLFGRDFWMGLSHGLERTSNMMNHNMEIAMDQLASSLHNSKHISDRLDEQVEQSLPPWLLNPKFKDQTFLRDRDIEAISFDKFGGIDEGLKVYMEGDGDHGDLDGHRVFTSDKEEDEVTEPVPDMEVEVVHRPTNFLDSFFWPFNVNRRRPQQWWQGPNVCVDREEIDESDNEGDEGLIQVFGELKSCAGTHEKYTCTTKTRRRGLHKTIHVEYRCCHGFARGSNGQCTKELQDLSVTLEEVGATDFLSLVKSTNLQEKLLRSSTNMTFFVPTNEAMQEFTADLEEDEINDIYSGLDGERNVNEVYLHYKKAAHDLSELVTSHVTQGVLYASQLRDEQVLQSLRNSTLRINTYSTIPPLATVNCARIISLNNQAKGGVIHMVDRVLPQATQSIADIVGSDTQFSILKQLVSKAGLLRSLREPGQWTLFAPTDAAFRTLDPSILEGLLEGNGCLSSIVKNHVLPNVICLGAVQEKARTINILQEYLLLHREDDKIFINDVQIVARDIIGTNGVMHIIDGVLMPEEAETLRGLLETKNLTRFLEAVEAAGLGDELDSLSNVTVFVPSNDAFETLPEQEWDRLLENNESLRKVLQYHIATPMLSGRDILNNYQAPTRSGSNIRINLYSKVPLLAGLLTHGYQKPVRMTASCGRVSTLDARACGAVVHVVEHVLAPPEGTIMDLLRADEDYSMFAKMLQDVGLDQELSVENTTYTVLAPTNHVFRALPEDELQTLLNSDNLKEELVRKHILSEHICCEGINDNTWLFMDQKRTMDGSSIHMRRTPTGRLMAGPARITHCHAPASNGVVHTVNHILHDLRPQQQPVTNRRVPIFSSPSMDIFFGF